MNFWVKTSKMVKKRLPIDDQFFIHSLIQPITKFSIAKIAIIQGYYSDILNSFD